MGMIYAIIGVGYSLCYGVLNITNLAHGAFYVLGGYFTYIFTRILGFHIIIAMLLSFIVNFILGSILEVTLIERIRHHPTLTLVGTSAFRTTVEMTILLIFGAYFLTVPGFYKLLYFRGISLSLQRAITAIVSLLLIVLLTLFINKTKYGTVIRLVSQNRDLAMLVGVDVKKIYMLTIGISSLLAAAAGSLLAPEYSLYPTVGGEIMLTTLVIVVVGGMGSLQGTFLASVILGITETMTSYYISTALKYISTYIILILVLLLKPSGLFGVAVERA